MPLLECVPNVSVGRDRALIARLAGALRGVDGAHLLDHSSDPEHNRSVFTLVGEPSPLAAALEALYAIAVESVDLAAHAGAHPRIGAVDVVPLVPLRDSTMDDAVDTARRLGAVIAARHGVPIYFYESAATRPERRDLAAIRRGGLEALAERMSDEPWRPDAGPPAPHPTAGVSAIGARDILIAFNALLDTDEVGVARAVARVVRASNGGLPAVKALGVALPARGAAQVSMNLVDYRITSPATALAAVRREAARHGAEVVSTELVGLMPEAALGGAAPEDLALENFAPEKLLEHHLRRLGLAD